ncbi:hypothetical protein [Haliscomenobacter sp.]|uniref:hypothetical protein n=1 Tax=Haliscomenobacter sp. TaxID=2717303 RepID=UPI003364EEE1
MFALLKFIYILFRSGRDLLNPNINPLRHAPAHIKYFASILLGCFWSLAFGLYVGELMTIGYNMLGHIAIISMVFVTWKVFRTVETTYSQRQGTQDWLRMPDRSSRCDELTEEQRVAKIKEWYHRNVWNDPALAEQDRAKGHMNWKA